MGLLARRLLLMLGMFAGVLLVAEGAASLFAGRLLFTPVLRAWWGIVSTPAAGADVFALRPPRPVAVTPAGETGEIGPYRTDPDPRVGYTLRTDTRLQILDAPVTTDALGLRARPGAPAAPGSQHIVVLGDSVAFGFGLPDEQVLAVRLEAALAQARNPVPAGERAVACRTVAVPGWNHRNAVHFLLDHWDELQPDIVLYMPVANDLMDTDGVTEQGLRRAAPDSAQADPWLSICQGTGLTWLKPLLKDLLGGNEAAVVSRLGTPALESDLSPESSRRIDDNAASIALLAREVARHRGRLALLPYKEGTYTWLLQERLLRDGLDVPWMPLFATVLPEFVLPTDPHPNAETVEAMARWVATGLLARGWVSRGAGGAVPRADAAHIAHRAEHRGAPEVAATCARLRSEARALLRPALDWRSGDGLSQIYGGLNEDGSAGARLALLLGRPPDRVGGGVDLELELAPLARRSDLYPLAIAVFADGASLGSLTLTADGPLHARLPLPARAAGGVAGAAARAAGDAAGDAAALVPLEVRLVPEHWVVIRARDADRVASFRPLRVACTGR